MTDRETIIRVLKEIAHDKRMLNHADYWALICAEAAELLKTQEQVINDMYSRYEGLCKDIREKYESDDVCGLCQYDGAYVGESGDWMNECPGFETNDCFCMKNSVRIMCGQPLIEEE